MVHFPPFASTELCIHSAMTGYCPAGLPHSEIPGSKPVCGSPRLIAAYRVLRRLSAPRHPPCTLSSLTKLEHSFHQRILSLLTRFSCQRTKNLGSTLPSIDLGSAKEPRIPRCATVSTKNFYPLFRQINFPIRPGGADRVRTDDLRLARAALSQLSYSPVVPLARAPGDGGPR